MATDKAVTEAQKQESCSPAASTDTPVQVKLLQVSSKCTPIGVVQPPPAATRVIKGDSISKIIPAGQGQQPSSSTVTASTLQTSSPSVMVIAKVATPGGVSTNAQTQVTKPALSQAASMKQVSTPGRTVVIRAAAPQPLTVAPRITQTASHKLAANIQIPPGMMLIQSDSGQLMLVSQQALAQAQQGPRGVSGQVSRILAPQVSATAGNKSNEKVTVIRMAAPPSFQPALVQKTAVVKQETLESVKKCKNFLVTLIKLASNDTRSVNMANSVKGLVKSLLEGKLEAEEFTEQLYQELKSTPQPCLVPFLKKSLPAVRHLTADPQLFIQQASTSSCNPNTQSSTMKQSSTDTRQSSSAGQQGIHQSQGVTLTPGLVTLAQSRNYISKSSRPSPKHTVVQSGKHLPGTFSLKQPMTQDPSQAPKSTFKDNSGSYKEDDDINDVASMAGVNLREENARILTTMVGSVVQSCQDQLFLSPNPVLSRILRTGQGLGITDVGPEVVAVVSHATQECLRGLIEKLTAIAEHRKAVLKEDLWHAKVSDVRSQLRFMEELEGLRKKRKDEEERERLLRLARSRSHTEDPEHQQLKQRAKELQQIEEAQMQQREANLTALAAIGPRKKRPLEPTESQVTLLPRQGVQKVTRVTLRDLLVCMEQDPFLRHSLTLYKAML